MESKQSRREFVSFCVKAGGVCCALSAWGRHVRAEDGPAETKAPETKPIDFTKLSYCGIPCEQACGLYKATVENDVERKKAEYEQQEMKKNFGLEFDPDKVFCHTCKPGDKPMKIGMDQCVVRKCALANGAESCVQCRNLKTCDKEFWKTWPTLYAYSKKNQDRYLAQPGARLIENRSKG